METCTSPSHFPACFVELPLETEGRRAAFYLAAEEYIADHLPEGSYFFTWQIGPTVVMGRNQVAHQEVDLEFCRREGIDVCRRRSGGGAIFADERNIMTSLITEACPVEPLFAEYAEAVASALRQLGAPTMVAGRNDIVLVNEELRMKNEEFKSLNQGNTNSNSSRLTLHSSLPRKVCGNAFYHRQNRCIAHGTMLYDTNPRLMEGALHPDVSKFEQKGVKSVRSRVGLLKDYLPFGVGTLRQRLRTLLCNRTTTLTAEDIRQIERLEQRYYKDDFLNASTSALSPISYTKTISRRIEGCGMVELQFSLQDNLITDIQLHGDFFDLGHASEFFQLAFVGQSFTPESLRQSINTHHPEHSIRGLNEAALMSLVCNEQM